LDDPTYTVDGVLHYCVANMPAAVPKTSAPAFCNAALPFGLKIADMGIKAAAKADRGIQNAVNTFLGKCTHKAVAEALEAEYTDLMSLI
ncbi:MAG: alanine dehydrogenase, partial [Eubacteriales bacterium]